MTVWTERHEIFLEHRPIVVGTAVTFVTHVSEIATGEPRSDGPITFVLDDATPAHEVQVPAPARPGIYLPEIVFSVPGELASPATDPREGAGGHRGSGGLPGPRHARGMRLVRQRRRRPRGSRS